MGPSSAYLGAAGVDAQLEAFEGIGGHGSGWGGAVSVVVVAAVTGALKLYRVTHQVVTSLPLTSKQKFRFGLARPDLSRPKRNFCIEVNGRFCTS